MKSYRAMGLAIGAFAGVVACGCEERAIVFDRPSAQWPDGSGSASITGPRLYLTNSGEDTVSVVDLETFEERYRAPVGLVPIQKEGPHHLVVTPDEEFAFIGISNFVAGAGSGPHGSHGTGTADGYCLKMSLRNHRVVGEVRVDPSPGDVRLMPDGITVLQSHFDLVRMDEVRRGERPVDESDATVAIIDGETMRLLKRVDVCPAPHGIATSEDGSEVYVSCWGSDELAVVRETESGDYDVTRIPIVQWIQTATPPKPDPEAAAPWPAPSVAPYGLAVSPADGRVWLSCEMKDVAEEAGELRVYDPSTGEMAREPAVSRLGNPRFGTFDSTGEHFYVAWQAVSGIVPDSIVVVTVATGAVRQVPMPPECLAIHAVAISEDDTTLYAVCEGDHVGPGSLLEVDAETLEMRRFVDVGVYPDDVAMVGE